MQHFSNVLHKSRAYAELKGLCIFWGWFNLHNTSFSVKFLWLTNEKPANLSCHGHFAGVTASELGTVPVLLTDTALLFLSGQCTHS